MSSAALGELRSVRGVEGGKNMISRARILLKVNLELGFNRI